MYQKLLMLSVVGFVTFNLSAQTFNGVSQPKQLSMGGVGVALSDSTGVAFNPASLSSSRIDDRFSFAFPSFGVSVDDRDEFIDSLDAFQDSNSIDLLSAQLDSLSSPAQLLDAANTSDALAGELSTLSGKRLFGGLGVVGIASIPNESIGLALVFSGDAAFGGQINFEDQGVLTDLASELREFELCASQNIASLGSCDLSQLDLQLINPSTGDVLFDVNSDLDSNVSLHGISFVEVGVAISSSIDLLGSHVSIGVTPKYVDVRVFDYVAGVETADIDEVDGSDYLAEYQDINIDVGIHVEFSDKMTMGLAGYNLVSRDYQATRFGVETGLVASIEPRWVVGFAYDAGWLTLALDTDVAEHTLAFGEVVQELGVGVEFSAFELAQLRLGYRTDMNEVNDDLYTVGAGFSPFGAHFDVGVAFNDDQVIGSMQLAYRF